jgi:hydrogenase maturation factor
VFGDMVTAMATTAFYYEGNEMYAVDNAVNNVIASGGEPYGLSVTVLLPEHSEEAVLRKIMGSVSGVASRYELDLFAGHTELVPTVNEPTIVVTAYGKVLFANRHKEISAGMDIVMTKWAGLYGGAILANLKKEELTTRYPKSYIEVAAGYLDNTSLMPELSVLKRISKQEDISIYAAHDVSNGGVFGALWQILSASNKGGQVEVSSIPIKQEIIEVSEFFEINPYMLNGQGSLLIITDNGDALVEAFNEENINAAVIGRTCEGNNRVVKVGEEERFLVAPKGDMLGEVIYGQKVPV